MRIIPTGWEKFQHYKGRRPPWIRLYRELLDNYQFACLPDASMALAPRLWLLASEYENGEIVASPEELSFRLHWPAEKIAESLKPLEKAGFFLCEHHDSITLADRKQDATPDKSRVEESRVEPTGAVAPAGKDDIWRKGVQLLTAKGNSERSAWGCIGRWRKEHGDERTHAGLDQARSSNAAEPIAFINGWFKAQTKARIENDPLAGVDY